MREKHSHGKRIAGDEIEHSYIVEQQINTLFSMPFFRMEQFSMLEDGEFSEEEMDKYVTGVRVYEDRFEWLLNLNPDARGELDDAGSHVYFKKITVTPDDERAWFKKHPQ